MTRVPRASLHELAATELAALVRAREVSPVELVDAHVAAIRRVNPKLNALIADRFEAARAEAAAAEQRLARATNGVELPPLFGVPCTVKEVIGTEGMPQTGGLWCFRDRVAAHDAPEVARLRAAGAIVLGVTNVPEGGLWYETVNRIWGRTNNPHDVRRTPGGSSGGEAALVACGASPFGVGSDIAGSLRIPAAFCGVVSHKPTGYMMMALDHFPPVTGTLRGYLVSGPIVRRVADLAPILRIMAGPDPGGKPWPMRGEPPPMNLRDVVVYPLEAFGRSTRPGARRAVRDATEALCARGARVGQLDRRWFRDAIAIWSAMMADADSATYAEVLGGGTPVKPVREMVKLAFGRSGHTFAALMIVLGEELLKYLPEQIEGMVRRGYQLKAELAELLGPNGVLLAPPYSRPAPRHIEPLLTPMHHIHTGIFSVLEVPATQVPVGLDPRGLPLGVQVVARPGNDHLSIAVAGALEQDFGGWQRPRSGPHSVAA